MVPVGNPCELHTPSLTPFPFPRPCSACLTCFPVSSSSQEHSVPFPHGKKREIGSSQKGGLVHHIIMKILYQKRASCQMLNLGIFRQAKKSSNFILDRISKKTEKIGFGGPGGGPLDPDRDLVPIPGGFRSGAPTATRIKPKIVFRTITKNKVLKFG